MLENVGQTISKMAPLKHAMQIWHALLVNIRLKIRAWIVQMAALPVSLMAQLLVQHLNAQHARTTIKTSQIPPKTTQLAEFVLKVLKHHRWAQLFVHAKVLSGKTNQMLAQNNVSQPLAPQDVSLSCVMTIELFATMENLRLLYMVGALLANARTAITTQSTNYATQFLIVRQINSNFKVVVMHVKINALPAKYQTRCKELTTIIMIIPLISMVLHLKTILISMKVNQPVKLVLQMQNGKKNTAQKQMIASANPELLMMQCVTNVPTDVRNVHIGVKILWDRDLILIYLLLQDKERGMNANSNVQMVITTQRTNFATQLRTAKSMNTNIKMTAILVVNYVETANKGETTQMLIAKEATPQQLNVFLAQQEQTEFTLIIRQTHL